MIQELREVDGRLEFYEGNTRVSINGEMIAATLEEIGALRTALIDETDFAEKYELSKENFAVLGRVSAKLNRHNATPTALTRLRVLEAYRVADAAGGKCGESGTLERLPQATEEPLVSVARDPETGHFQNRLLAEYNEMLSNPAVPASAITERMRVDKAFREAVEAGRRVKSSTSSQSQLSGDEVEKVREFVKAWKLERSPKFVAGYARIGGREYTTAQLEQAISAASHLGLL